jgi:hypothetical protein
MSDMRNIFNGYAEIEVPADDTELAKWRAIDWRFDALERPALIVSDVIAEQNKNINAMVAYRADDRDRWQNPAETLRLLTGDCEDYAILKMAVFGAWGLPPDSMALVVGEIAAIPQDEPHAFVVMEFEGRRFILDNKFDHLAEGSGPHASFRTTGADADYINWQPRKMFTGEGGFLFSKQFTIADAMRREHG